MSFSFTLSSSSVTISPGSSASITITQTSALTQAVTYRIANQVGGWDDSTTVDAEQGITASFPASTHGTPQNAATITGNGTLVLTLNAASNAKADTVETYIYGLVQIGGFSNGNQPVIVNAPISITIS